MNLETNFAGAWPFTTERRPGDVVALIVGDTNIADRTDPAAAFAGVSATLRSADAVFGQMEGLFAEPSDAPDRIDIPFKPGWRHSDPAIAAGYLAAGFAAVSCASNVAYPPEACAATAEALKAAGLAHCGIGADQAAARAPALVTVGGVRIGMLGYTSVFQPGVMAAGLASPGCATIRAHTAYQPGRRALEMPGDPPVIRTWADAEELAAMQDDIRRLRPQVDLLLLSCHWGVSGADRPQDYQREIAGAAVASGADLVFGHHPHVVQGAELIQGRPVFHSLGNFAFDAERMRGRRLDGLMLRLLVRDRRIIDLAVVPVRRDGANLVRIASAATGRDIMARFSDLSHDLGGHIRLRATDAALAAMS